MKLSLAVPAYKAMPLDDLAVIIERILRVMTEGKRASCTSDWQSYFGRPSMFRHHRHCRLTRKRVADLYEVPIPAPWEG